MKFDISTIDPDTNQAVIAALYEADSFREAVARHILALVQHLNNGDESSHGEFESYELYHGIMSERELIICACQSDWAKRGIECPIGETITFSPNDDDYSKHVIVRLS